MQFGSNAVNMMQDKTLPRIFIEWVEKLPRNTKIVYNQGLFKYQKGIFVNPFISIS